MNETLLNTTVFHSNFTPSGDMFFGPSSPGLSPLGYTRLVMCIAITLVNGFEIAILTKKGENRCIPDHLVLSLSVADLLVGIIYLVLDTFALVRHLLSSDVIMIAMTVMLPSSWFSIHASVLHTLCIGIERFVAVRYPLHYRGIMTKSKVIASVLLLWLFILASTVTLFFLNTKLWESDVLVTSESFLILFSGILLILIYGYIAWYVSARRRMSAHSDYRRRQSSVAYGNSNETKKTLFCILIAVAYIFCAYPVAITWQLGIYHPTPIFILLLNSLLNPLIYFWKGYVDNSQRKPMKSFLMTDSSNQP